MKERGILELRSPRLAGRETSARSLTPLRGGFLRWVPGRIPLSLHARGKAVEGIALDLPTAFSRTPATHPGLDPGEWKAIRDPARDLAQRRLLIVSRGVV